MDYQFQVSTLNKLLHERDAFVIKPSQGSGGKGILVIVGREGDKFIKSSGALIDDRECVATAPIFSLAYTVSAVATIAP